MARIRSPGYPSVALQVALQYAEQIYSLNRTNAIDRESAAKSMGYGGSSGASDKMIANLSHYGLTEKAGKGEIRIAQLAVDILRPENEPSKARALNEAAFNPQLFEILREKFPDGHFSPDALKNALSRMGFQEVAIGPASRAYTETCRLLKELGAYESHGEAQSGPPESTPEDVGAKGFGVMDSMEPMSAGVQSRAVAYSEMVDASGETLHRERTVYREEGAPGQYLRLVASGDLDDYLLEAIEDFVKRQRKRLQRAHAKSELKAAVEGEAHSATSSKGD